MAVYECNACSGIEVIDLFVPDCCSVCGGRLRLTHGSLAHLDGLEAYCIEAAETAYAEEAEIQAGEMRRAAMANCLLLAIAALILLASIGPSPAVMAACEQRHSTETCFALLNR